MDFDAAGKLGLKGALRAGFPRLTGISSSWGGMIDNGPTNRGLLHPGQGDRASASATFIRRQSLLSRPAASGSSTTSPTAAPAARRAATASVRRRPACPRFRASLCRAAASDSRTPASCWAWPTAASVSNPADPQYRRKSWALLRPGHLEDNAQTDPGLRPALRLAARAVGASRPHQSMFSPDVNNPSAGGLLGGTLYAGYGPGRCNCGITKTYPATPSARALGVAYQMDPKTVFRAGFAVSYGQVTAVQLHRRRSARSAWASTASSFGTPAYGDAALLLHNGLSYNMADLLAASYDPGIRPRRARANSAALDVDRDAGRPPRIVDWNLERPARNHEATSRWRRPMSATAARGSRPTRWSTITPFRRSACPRSASTSTMPPTARCSTSRMDSAAVVARGFKAPYAGFPIVLDPGPGAAALPAVRRPSARCGRRSATTGTTRSR